jgi:hypothetical protein
VIRGMRREEVLCDVRRSFTGEIKIIQATGGSQ